METLTSTKFDWKKVLVVAMLIILTGISTAGVTWYMMDGKNAEDNEKNQSEITSLKLKISELESEIESMIKLEDSSNNPTDESEVTDESQTGAETGDTNTPTPIIPTQ